MSEQIRVKTNFSDLINTILDKLPSDIWQNTDSKFLDPAMGGGQFIKEIVDRLRKMGYDDNNIKKRVYAAGETPFITRYVINTLKLPFTILSAAEIKEKEFMKFDVTVMNPPYQAPQKADGKRGGGDLLWPDFVIKAISDWTKEDGYIAAIHPSGWRKPESEKSKYNKLFDMMTHDHHMEYLEIHDTNDGQKTFGAGTRYDWYIIHKNCTGITNILDQNGQKSSVDLKKYQWLPNHSFKELDNLLGQNGPKSEIMFSASAYETRKTWVSENSDSKFKYPLVHSTPIKGNRFCFSSRNDKGHFGIAKAIFGDSGINDVIIDVSGQYGMTQHAMAIPIKDYDDGLKLKNFLMSDKFQNILNACSWSNFQIDWRMFAEFKEGFWREEE